MVAEEMTVVPEGVTHGSPIRFAVGGRGFSWDGSHESDRVLVHGASVLGFEADEVLYRAIGVDFCLVADDAVSIANGCGQVFEAGLHG